MDFFQIMLFQQVSCDLSKHYQQVSESAQDSLQPHPSSLLAKCHWQKNVTETDLKAGEKNLDVNNSSTQQRIHTV